MYESHHLKFINRKCVFGKKISFKPIVSSVRYVGYTKHDNIIRIVNTILMENKLKFWIPKQGNANNFKGACEK